MGDSAAITEVFKQNIAEEDQRRSNKTLNENSILDKISDIRAQNNKSWMKIMKVAFEYAPYQAKEIMEDIIEQDKEISKLCGKLIG